MVITPGTATETAANARLLALSAATLAAFGLVYLFLLFRANINWDEFNFLAQIHAVQDGRAGPGLNNFHTVLYGWLSALPGTEIDRILVARLAQLGLFAGAMVILFRIARQFFSLAISVLVVLLTVAYTDLLRHAFSFRFDTLCLFFSLLALYLYPYRKSSTSAVVAGVSLAVGLLVSVKSVFYLIPILAIAVVLWTEADQRRAHRKRTALFLAALGIAFVSIYLIRAGLAATVPTGAQAAGATDLLGFLGTVGSKMFLEEGLFPKADYLSRSVRENGGQWLMIAGGVLVALGSLFRQGEARRQALFILLCLVPLASVAIYRNAFPYFYVMVIPPAMLAAGLALEAAVAFSRRLPPTARMLILVAPIAAVFLTASMYLLLEHREGIAKQRVVVQAVHEMFPEPVAYIDGYGMVSSFPKAGLWMSTWGMDNYHQSGEPVMERILRESQPKFLLANHRALRGGARQIVSDDDRYNTLLPEDVQILQENFVHHWGPIRIAGKRVEILEPGRPESFEVLIEGPYTVEFSEPVLVNGVRVGPSGTVDLAQGVNTLESTVPGTVILRWGSGLSAPDFEPPQEWLWDGL